MPCKTSERDGIAILCQIGEKLNLELSDHLSLDHYVERLLDRLEGNDRLAHLMTFTLSFKQTYLIED